MVPLKGHGHWVIPVTSSPDGKHIVSGSTDKKVRVWDAQTGQSVMDPLKGHGDWVTSVAFSPDGRHIVSGSHDKTIRVWNAQTGQRITDPLIVSCFSTCPAASNPVLSQVTPIHSEDGNITMSNFQRTLFCDRDCCSDRSECHGSTQRP